MQKVVERPPHDVVGTGEGGGGIEIGGRYGEVVVDVDGIVGVLIPDITGGGPRGVGRSMEDNQIGMEVMVYIVGAV